MSAVASPSVAFRQLTRWLLPSVAVVLLTVFFYAPATTVLDVTLDASNYGTYSAFTAEGRQYGAEVLPMAGPYGFVMYGWTYAGQLYWTRVVLELLTKLALALLVIGLFRETRSRVVRWLWVAALLVLLQGAGELAYDFTVCFAGLYLVLNYPRPGRLLTSCAAAAVLGLLALSKGTLLILAAVLLGLVALEGVALKDLRRFAWITGTFGLVVIGLWAAAGQNPLHLPGFAHAINELSGGYNSAMGLQELPRTFATGASALGLLLGLLVAFAWTQRRHLTLVLASLLMAGFSFLKWKHGFVRADGHVYIFYQYAAIAVLTAWLLLHSHAATPMRGFAGRWIPAALAVAGLGLAIYGPGDQPLNRLAWQARSSWHQLGENLAVLRAPSATKARLDAALQQNQAVFTLPDVRRTVGRATIDFFGYEHGYLALNELNYRPRPMGGGGFNVFTPYLQQRNARAVADPATRPEFFLLNLQTIDNRLAAGDDATTLRTLVAGYRPEISEQGMLLLHAQPGAAPAPAPRRLLSRPLHFGETISLPVVAPDEMLLATFELPASFFGKLRAALYKPSALYLSFDGEGLLDPGNRRLVPSFVTLPVILSPALERTRDLLDLYSREAGKTVHDFRLGAELPGCWDAAHLTVTFYAAPRPEPLSPAVRQSLAGPLDYPMANRRPIRIEPANQVRRVFNGLPVQMLETPGALVFDLQSTDRACSFDFGLDPECYTRGTTDGVEFYAELRAPGSPPVVLYRQALHPVTVPADRGSHRHRLVLPPMIKPGSQLFLHTDPGPARDSSWDWAYYSGIHFEPGPFLPEQFPGFNVVPVELEADYCGALGTADGHLVFMLNAPGRLTFALDGRARTLQFAGGLREGAYTQGNTDGAEFVVTLRQANGHSRELLRRWLRPKTVPADRGRQAFSVTLPQHAAGDHLEVRTTGGPNGDLAWDWTYLDGLELR
jgi:hypothetical protein